MRPTRLPISKVPANPTISHPNHKLIAAIITENGVARPPYADTLRAMCAL